MWLPVVFSYRRPVTANMNLSRKKIKKETGGAKKSTNMFIKVVILVWTFLIMQQQRERKLGLFCPK